MSASNFVARIVFPANDHRSKDASIGNPQESVVHRPPNVSSRAQHSVGIRNVRAYVVTFATGSVATDRASELWIAAIRARACAIQTVFAENVLVLARPLWTLRMRGS